MIVAVCINMTAKLYFVFTVFCTTSDRLNFTGSHFHLAWESRLPAVPVIEFGHRYISSASKPEQISRRINQSVKRDREVNKRNNEERYINVLFRTL